MKKKIIEIRKGVANVIKENKTYISIIWHAHKGYGTSYAIIVPIIVKLIFLMSVMK